MVVACQIDCYRLRPWDNKIMKDDQTKSGKLPTVSPSIPSMMFAFFAMCLSSWVSGAEIVPKNYNNLPVVILKIDDLKNYKIAKLAQQEAAWDRFVSYIQSKGIKANLGAIGSNFESSNATAIAFYKDLKNDILSSGVVELFNHSMCYCPEAFDSSSNYEQQYSVLDEAQSVIRKSMGITMVGFGSGGNKRTVDTLRVMNNHPDMKIWFFGRDEISGVKLDSSKVLNLSRAFPYADIDNIESVSVFLSNFENVKTRPFMVYQGHAGKWNETKFNMFKKAMDALLNKYPKLKFMTISEYYKYSGGNDQGAERVGPITTPSKLEILRPVSRSKHHYESDLKEFTALFS